MHDIEVRESPIEGRGIFALRDFKAGERVVEWGERKVLSEEALAALSSDERERYVSFKNGQHLLSGEPMRYVNHSCDPNTKPESNADVAIRDIRAGEEITSAYLDFESGKQQCQCGVEGCKGK